jgi:hypothetical protein
MTQCLVDILRFQIRVGLQDLLSRLARREESKESQDREA